METIPQPDFSATVAVQAVDRLEQDLWQACCCVERQLVVEHVPSWREPSAVVSWPAPHPDRGKTARHL